MAEPHHIGGDKMNRLFAVVAVLAVLCLEGTAQANVFNLGPGFTNLETVTVGDPGNVGELSGAGAHGYGDDRICGTVNYTYNIGKYEVTAKQYCDFLNAKAKIDTYGLYSIYMDTANDSFGCNIKRTGISGHYSYSVASDWANRPVNCVSYWDACRFTNWLSNGQGNGDTEKGVYTLRGYNGTMGSSIQRNNGWTWAVASEDEWYKAAYYKGNGTNAGYWDYATKSNTAPSNVGSDGYTDPGNHANYRNWKSNPDGNGYTIDAPYYRTNVGEFENSASAYGTFDQSGNVWEWNEAIIHEDSTKSYRDMRGGSICYYDFLMEASGRGDYVGYPTFESSDLGFRVVQSVPEPDSIIALFAGLGCLMPVMWRRRR